MLAESNRPEPEQEHHQPEEKQSGSFFQKHGYHGIVIAVFDILIYLLVSLFVFVIYPSSVDSLTQGMVAALKSTALVHSGSEYQPLKT